MTSIADFRSMNLSVFLGTERRVIPASAFTRVEDLPPERQAEYAEAAAQLADAEAKYKALDDLMAADAKGHESNRFNARNVADLNRDQAMQEIRYITDMIVSGEADTTVLQAANGQTTTNNYRQYVYWLQQHVKDLEGGGQSTLAQA
jgi:spore germination protein YaaH